MNIRSLKRRLKDTLPIGVSTAIIQGLNQDLPVQKQLTQLVNNTILRTSKDDGTDTQGPLFHPRSTCIVTRFDSWEEQQNALRKAKNALNQASIPYALAPMPDGKQVVVLRDLDRTIALRALADTFPNDEAWHLSYAGRSTNFQKSSVSLAKISQSTEIPKSITKKPELELFSNKISAKGVQVGSPRYGVKLSFWKTIANDSTPRADGGTYQLGTLKAPNPNGVAAYLSPQGWHDAIESPTKWPPQASLPHIYQITDPIDVVYTWVNGEDPAWIERKNRALETTDSTQLNDTAISSSRYASRNELMYSLRSLEMYANWVRNIYIVTDGQIPPWLDTSNPRIHIVDHTEIFADPTVLPVFNSHAIESQLHHIEGLSNSFIYMNDDIFFGAQVQAADFFHNALIGKFFPSVAVLDIDPPSANDLPVLSAAKQARALLGDEFGVTITNKFKHTPMPLQRDVLFEMEQRFPTLFRDVASSKFRHPDDYSIPSGLYHFYAFATGRAVPGNISYGYQDLAERTLPLFLAWITKKHRYAVFCLNDTYSSAEQTAELRSTFIDAMEQCYPFKSSFECD